MRSSLYNIKPVKKSLLSVLAWLIVCSASNLVTDSCTTNPATGQLQLSLISEQQEIQIGQQYDQLIVEQIGVVKDPELTAYVNNLGQKIAHLTERPNLPWTFRVLDDPTVNAFSIPGGFVYVTRGILSYMENEAQLSGVLGHEIGHVTARHVVEMLSSQELVQLGLGIGVAVVPQLQNFVGLIGAGLTLLYLKFNRDAETQADDLGVRYMSKASYDPRQLIAVMAMLDQVSKATQVNRSLPEWLSTHPDPGNREKEIQNQITKDKINPEVLLINRDPYLDTLKGLVFGVDPREGYFDENIFYQPTLQFRFDFPAGWQTANNRVVVTGVSPQQDAIIQLGIINNKSPEVAANDFFSQQGVRDAGRTNTTINNIPAIWAKFTAAAKDSTTGQNVDLSGLTVFLSYKNRTYQFLSYSTTGNWPNYEGTVTTAFKSFDQVTDPNILLAQPVRLNVVTIDTPMTLTEYNQRFPSAIPLDQLALVNQLDPNAPLQVGQRLKVVVK